MQFQNKEKNLISIDDLILKAKKLGVDFGRGNPRERLRYLTKIGLLPHAKRKSFNGNPPNGAYPENVIDLLSEIDRKVKSGKSIQQLKIEKSREKAREKEKRKTKEILSKTPYVYPYPVFPEFPQFKKDESQKENLEPEKEVELEKEIEPEKISQVFVSFSQKFVKAANVLKVIFLVLIFGVIIFYLAGRTSFEQDFRSLLLASFARVQRFVQAPPDALEDITVRETLLPFQASEPYLTINAETDINAPLNVKEQITAPALNLIRDEFQAGLTLADLTADRTYTFPNLSGTICLTTGNCVGLAGEVFSPGGLPNRLAKFITSQEIGISSIEDLYPEVALTIDASGRVGLGTRTPAHALHVTGRIQATGDICTDLAGGRCLSTLPLGGAPRSAPPAVTGIGGSGATGYLPIWTAATALGNSIIYQSNGNIGIGTTTPSQVLDVAGSVRVLGFQMPTGAQDNYILTSDADGTATWRSFTGALPDGESGQTLRFSGGNWLPDYFLYNTGDAIGIGTTSTLATLTLSGNAVFSAMTLPQLALRYDDDNYLNFSINSEQSLLESSKRLVFNSLTGEIKLGSNVNIFDAFGAEVRGATFISTSTDSTVRKSGELVFRASLPIFRFSVPSQTNSTTNTPISKTFSLANSLDSLVPPQLPGTSRFYAFLINFADNIATTSNSSWRVYRPTAGTEPFSFQFSGQGLVNLETGNPHLTATTTLPDNDWQLEMRNPSADNSIRIFNIFLLVFDQIN